MDWLHSYASLRDHPKTKKLCRLLSVKTPEAVGLLHCLWWWSMDYAPDGDLTDVEPDVIADGAGWEGDPGELISALLKANKEKGGYGFLEERGGRLLIHDHQEYIGAYMSKRARDAQRKREERELARLMDVQGTGDGHGDGTALSASPSSLCPSDVHGTSIGRPSDGGRTASRDARALTEEREKREEREPPLPPQPVDNCQEQEQGEEQAPSEEQEQGSLESLRHNPPCEDRDCDVRSLRIHIRSQVAEIVGTDKAGQLYNPSSPINKTLAGMAGYICAACWKASAAPGVTMADRQPICAKALREYVELLADFNRGKPIKSLPAYLRTRYGHMTEAPVSDELLAELRLIERKASEAARCEEGDKNLAAAVTPPQLREPSKSIARAAAS